MMSGRHFYDSLIKTFFLQKIAYGETGRKLGRPVMKRVETMVLKPKQELKYKRSLVEEMIVLGKQQSIKIVIG